MRLARILAGMIALGIFSGESRAWTPKTSGSDVIDSDLTTGSSGATNMSAGADSVVGTLGQLGQSLVSADCTASLFQGGYYASSAPISATLAGCQPTVSGQPDQTYSPFTLQTTSQGTALLTSAPSEYQSYYIYAPSGSGSVAPGAPCPIQSASGSCLSLASSPQADTQLISATFPISQGQFYKVHLQAMSGDASSWLGQLSPSRNGPTYENVDAFGLNAGFQISPEAWASYDFYFQANETIANGRILMILPRGSHMILGQLTVTPVTVQAWKTASQATTLLNGTAAELQTYYSSASAGSASVTPGSACPPRSVTGNCLSLTSSPQAATQLISARFSVTQGQFYRVFVQAMSGDSSPWVGRLSANRDAPPNANLDAYDLSASFELWPSTWSPFTFFFQANQTASDGRIALQFPAGSRMILGGLVVTPVSVQVVNPATPPAAPSGSIPRQYFGMHYHNRNNWPTVPFGALRSWDHCGNCAGQAVGWQRTETSKGVYDWTLFDAWLSSAQSRGVDPIWTFGHTPSWAASDTSQCTSLGCPSPPQNEQDWKDFITAIATRGAGKVKYWELWNEPNIKDFWSGTAAQMATMANDAYAIIKAIDPVAKVLTPSPSFPWYGRQMAPSEWFEGYFAAGGTSADIIAFHGYSPPLAPGIRAEDLAGTIMPNMQELLNAYGLSSKPVWDTEAGVDTNTVSGANEAAFLAKYYLLHWSLGVERFSWYSWDNSQFGTLWTAANGINAAGTAYQQVENWMVGSTMTAPCALSGGMWTCGLTLANGLKAQAVWLDALNSNSVESFSPSSTYNMYYDLTGASATFAGSLAIGKSPILLSASSKVTIGAGTSIVSGAPLSGSVSLTIPPGAVSAGTRVTISSMAAPPAAGGSAISSVADSAIDIECGGCQPASPVTLSASYASANLGGANPSGLIWARWDPSLGQWVRLTSQVDTARQLVTALVQHFSIFQIMISKAKTDLDGVRIIPNPFRPALGHAAMGFFNMPANARVRIYNHGGALLKDLTANGAGLAAWDGTNQSGAKVASGVYYALIEGAGKTKTISVAIQR